MFFSYNLALPANTPKTAPVEVEALLTHGIIHRVEIEFPAGCAGLVHVAVRRGLHQLWPLNPDGDLASDDWIIAWDEHQEVLEEPYAVTLTGYNLDDIYPHTPIVRIGLLPQSLQEAATRSASLVERLAKLIGLGP
mgnify:CR=1 FL=1